MFIIIEKECIDTSDFIKMKIYEKAGIIACTYLNKEDGTEFELPISFDDPFDAECVWDYILEALETGKETYVVAVRASVPVGLLARIKRGIHLNPEATKQFNLIEKKDEDI